MSLFTCLVFIGAYRTYGGKRKRTWSDSASSIEDITADVKRKRSETKLISSGSSSLQTADTSDFTYIPSRSEISEITSNIPGSTSCGSVESQYRASKRSCTLIKFKCRLNILTTFLYIKITKFYLQYLRPAKIVN